MSLQLYVHSVNLEGPTQLSRLWCLFMLSSKEALHRVVVILVLLGTSVSHSLLPPWPKASILHLRSKIRNRRHFSKPWRHCRAYGRAHRRFVHTLVVLVSQGLYICHPSCHAGFVVAFDVHHARASATSNEHECDRMVGCGLLESMDFLAGCYVMGPDQCVEYMTRLAHNMVYKTRLHFSEMNHWW